jgi:hypothetical protein
MFCIFLEGIATRHEDILGSVSPLLFIDFVLHLVRYGHAVVCGGHTVRDALSVWSEHVGVGVTPQNGRRHTRVDKV